MNSVRHLATRKGRLAAFYFLCSIAPFISGCSSVPSKPLSSAQLSSPRSYQESLQINGAINVQYTQNDQAQSVTGSFEWQQEQEKIAIDLSSPLGQTIAKIKQDAQAASLEQPKLETLRGADIEQLLSDNLGWTIPVNGLRNWLQGFDLAVNGKQVAIPAMENFLLQSQGWDLRFVSWQEIGGRVSPKRIDLKRSTPEFGEVKIRITIDE